MSQLPKKHADAKQGVQTVARLRQYSLQDPAQDRDSREFWGRQSIENKLMVLEQLRRIWLKFDPQRLKHGNLQRFRRVLRVVQRA